MEQDVRLQARAIGERYAREAGLTLLDAALRLLEEQWIECFDPERLTAEARRDLLRLLRRETVLEDLLHWAVVTDGDTLPDPVLRTTAAALRVDPWEMLEWERADTEDVFPPLAEVLDAKAELAEVAMVAPAVLATDGARFSYGEGVLPWLERNGLAAWRTKVSFDLYTVYRDWLVQRLEEEEREGWETRATA